MKNKFFKIDLERTDFSLLFSVLILVILGTASVYSASSYRAEQFHGYGAYYFRQHLIRLVIGLICLMILASSNYRFWLQRSMIFYFISAGLVLYLLTGGPGVLVRNGAASWLRLGPIIFQPSDFARYGLIMFLAKRLCERREFLDYFQEYAIHLGIVFLIVIPVALEPDLGTAALITSIAFIMFLFAEVPFSFLFASFLTLMTGALTYILVYPHSGSRVHVNNYISGLLGLPDMPYQLKQALIALSHGGILGRGIGESLQRYLFLPEAHNDFIFAIIGEEYGLIGTVGVLVLFFVIIRRGLTIARQAPDGYGRLLAGGITACIASYALVNAGVAIGVLPTTGIPMPFLSYGGSAIIAHLSAIGLLLNISTQSSPSFERAPGWRIYKNRLQSRIFKPSTRPVYRQSRTWSRSPMRMRMR
ncbi:cell division protein FtsW [candidate division KSB1 bacterium]|nr:cell division protein FtsW [candidate division KSB1 bacterium]